jgi:hypothetical protein
LKEEISHAGYLGETVLSESITGAAPPIAANFTCATNNQWGRMIAQPIYGMNDTLKLSETADYSGCINKKDYLRGDLLAVRAMSRHTISPQEATDTSNKHRLYFLSSLEQGLIFQGQDYHQNKLDTHLQSLHEVQASVYYIASAIGADTITCSNEQSLPALFRETLNSQGKPQREEIAQGIENLQAQYGIDTDGDGSVNQYKNGSPNLNWPEVVSVRIWILARASCPESAFTNTETYRLGDQEFTPNDHYRRLLLTTTISLKNS